MKVKEKMPEQDWHLYAEKPYYEYQKRGKQIIKKLLTKNDSKSGINR